MHLKKLEIFGFKSFAEKATLTFEPGITAVVGPNGCGKSNVFDAIRWVLGEQSAKELRGSAMGDVIFNGTQTKTSLGFAEVSLTFSNASGMLPIDYEEVTITRRLFRSGESEYLLNKTTVRLKDIQELLMGTGIGAEAYSLIQQGRVDLIVSAKPEDRRSVLDEASGITKYKSKKREALNKLKDTENNLLRVNDITVEVKRQIGSIERQANKARRYKEAFEKLKQLEVQLAHYQLQHFDEDHQKLTLSKEALQAQEAALTADMDGLGDGLSEQINQLGALDDTISEVRGQEIKLEGQIDLNHRQIGFNQERLQSIEQNDGKLKDQREQLIQRAQQQQEKISSLEQDAVHLEEDVLQGEGDLELKQEGLATLQAAIAEAKEQIQAYEEKNIALSSQQIYVRNELTEVMKAMQGNLGRQRRLESEQEKVLEEKQVAQEKQSATEARLAEVAATLVAVTESHQRKEIEINTTTHRLAQMQEEMDELKKRHLFLESQKDFIEKLHTQYHDIPDPVVQGKLSTSVPPMDHHTGIIGKVKEVATLRTADAPEGPLYEIICESKFIELDPVQISLKIQEIAEQIKVLGGYYEALADELQSLRASLASYDQERQEQEKVKSVLEAQQQDVAQEMKKLNEELTVLQTEFNVVAQEVAQAQETEEYLNVQLISIKEDMAQVQKGAKSKQDWIAEKTHEREESSVVIAQLATEIKSKKDKLNSQRDNYRIFAEALENFNVQMHKIDDELVEQQSKVVELKQANEAVGLALEEIKQQKEALKVGLEDHLAHKEEMGRQINNARAQMHAAEDEIKKIQQKIHAQDLKRQEIGFKETGIKERLSQAYKIDWEVLMTTDASERQYEWLLNDTDAVQAAETEAQQLRKRCDGFGTVNLVAIEEYEELKERFEFLTKQQSDLFEAKSHLMSTINKINRSTRQMFMDTFTRVSEEFRIYFRMLFGGGEAQLVLMDPENVLESGIDIIARPPGKKLQNISLLSGGEKTLTAIALIFGIFKVNPSPFCVLDEIDAALDESNVGRFSYLLKDFSKIAQFIVITHNKRTMSEANVMYGVTMPETGASRIVSVKFGEEEHYLDAKGGRAKRVVAAAGT